VGDEEEAADTDVAEQDEEELLHSVVRRVQFVRQHLEERDVEKCPAGDALKWFPDLSFCCLYGIA
jgi:hypothetical protein